VIPSVSRLPEDGIPVPKHVGVGTYHELCFMICILLNLVRLLVDDNQVSVF